MVGWETCSSNDNGRQGVRRISRGVRANRPPPLPHLYCTCTAPWEPMDGPRIMQMTRGPANESDAAHSSFKSLCLQIVRRPWQKETRPCCALTPRIVTSFDGSIRFQRLKLYRFYRTEASSRQVACAWLNASGRYIVEPCRHTSCFYKF